MGNVALYHITKTKHLPGYYNCRVSITEDQALSQFDIGVTEFCKQKDAIIYELRAYEGMGYILKSLTNELLESLF